MDSSNNIEGRRRHQRTPSQVELNEFKALTKLDASSQLKKELDKLLLTAPQNEVETIRTEFNGFEKLFQRYLCPDDSDFKWTNIEPLPKEAIVSYGNIVNNSLSYENIRANLNKLIVIKLNGGLGTSMGCKGPKSTITVRDDLTFLDLIIRQLENINLAYNVNVPLVLMNSFNTDEETNKVINKYNHIKVKIYTFNQSRYPRVDKENLLPIAKSAAFDSDVESWYPPGHGDLYESFYNSGLLKMFLNEGKEYVFVSNSDNLGATVDMNILNFLLNPPNSNKSPEFLMEVTDKTRADVKGGTLINYQGKLRLLEIAQVPKENVDEFKSVSKFKIFNTNNLWINLKAIERVIEEETLHMEIIVNNKTTDKGVNVIQLETASGAAIKNFDGAVGINVPRSRFLPVKTTSDLMLIMSNLYTQKKGLLEMNPKRSFPSVPLVKLGSGFAKVNEFLKRFGSIPDCLELDHLTVSGDVTFGKSVALRGTVIIIANHGDRIDIPAGSILENKIVSGNLRILDH
ncbi:UTP--glucose-1-phosphate uridylyltransferase isoform X2 [Brachionus plicatilis]|uniref:UTP--glucose-1-phosphate uridylyltransferase n=1 Tax=Brachionus plicatilis TaxID=10195 RepID=A0A3M7S8Q6_BRAPC|nr:UTP--glucose-1-phosphate uridylyltransferase isoform X2 [Brachionus plicatilis]